MSETFSREILRRNVAQICQTIGWNGVNSTPMDILVHVLEKYIKSLGTQAIRYAEQFNRTEPNLHDLGLVFRDLHVQLPELAEYTRSVPPVPPPVSVDRFPKPKESNLNFLKPGSHEVVTRPMHVHEHLPPMYPEKERDTPAVAGTIEIRQNGIENVENRSCTSPEISVTDSPEKPKDIFKRPIDPVSLPSSKKPRLRLEEEERTREISSVMMTMSGFLSPAREGKLPEARPPTIMSDKYFDKHKSNSHHSNPIKVPILEKSDKKSKKNKLLNGKVMKSKRKDKSHKGESSKSSKYPPGYAVAKSKNIRALNPAHLNHVNMLAPKTLPPPQKTAIPPIAPSIVPEPIIPVIKQEPIETPFSQPLLTSKNRTRVEDAIPVPRRIPISRSPLVPNSVPVNKQSSNNLLIPDIEIKKEVVEEEVKLASQPDRSKINIFKRISNKSKEDKHAPEVVQNKVQSDSLISRLQNSYVNSVESKSNETYQVKGGENVVNNNDNSALDYSKTMDLRTNEVISIDDDSMDSHPMQPFRPPPVEPRPSISVNKSLQSPYPKEIASVSPKIKKEKKHKDKKDKAAKLEAKLLKKQQQQLAFEMAQVEKQNAKLSGAKTKSGRSKNDGKIPQMPPVFPFFPPMAAGRGLIPGPGLIPNPGLIPGGDFLAGLANNPALRGLTSPNILSNPFALGAGGPGLIPGPSFLHGGMPNPLMSMSGFPHSSRSTSMKIPPMLRRPSLEVIPVENDDDRGSLKSPLSRDKDRQDKHKSPTIPNILQKHKKSSKDHKTNMYKLPPVQPDITIELNPPREQRREARPPPPRHSPPRVRSPTPEPVRPAPPPVVPSPKLELKPEPLEVPSEEPKEVENDRKKDKSHKKDKKDRDGVKIKKKKDKKDKNKDKSEKKRLKEEKPEKIKKEKKDKKKERIADGLVPKLTLKLGSNSPLPPSSPDVYKLNIKPVVKREESPAEEVRSRGSSPELAQIAALVTRPPRPREASPPADNARRNRPPSAHSKYKRLLLKPLKAENEETPVGEETLPTPFYVDEQGNKIWVCPACRRPDNGSPMIGCDGCDGWYHWVCVGITEEPGATEDWFCRACRPQRRAPARKH